MSEPILTLHILQKKPNGVTPTIAAKPTALECNAGAALPTPLPPLWLVPEILSEIPLSPVLTRLEKSELVKFIDLAVSDVAYRDGDVGNIGSGDAGNVGNDGDGYAGTRSCPRATRCNVDVDVDVLGDLGVRMSPQPTTGGGFLVDRPWCCVDCVGTTGVGLGMFHALDMDVSKLPSFATFKHSAAAKLLGGEVSCCHCCPLDQGCGCGCGRGCGSVGE